MNTGWALAFLAYAQGDRGTITGTVSDPLGAIIAGAPIEARNAETGATFPAAHDGHRKLHALAIADGHLRIVGGCPGIQEVCSPKRGSGRGANLAARREPGSRRDY